MKTKIISIVMMITTMIMAACQGNSGNGNSAQVAAENENTAKSIWENFFAQERLADTSKYVVNTEEAKNMLYLYRATKKESATTTEYNNLYKIVCYQNDGYMTVVFLNANSEDGVENSTLSFYKYQDGKLTKDNSVIDTNIDYMTWNAETESFSNLAGEVYISMKAIEIKDARYFQSSDDEKAEFESIYQWNGSKFEK